MKRFVILLAIFLLLPFSLRAQETRKTVECQEIPAGIGSFGWWHDQHSVCDTVDTLRWYILRVDTVGCEWKIHWRTFYIRDSDTVWMAPNEDCWHCFAKSDSVLVMLLDTTWAKKLQGWWTPDELERLYELLAPPARWWDKDTLYWQDIDIDSSEADDE